MRPDRVGSLMLLSRTPVKRPSLAQRPAGPSQGEIEAEDVGGAVSPDGELDVPLATHLALHALNEIVAVAEMRGGPGLRGQAVPVFRHVARARDFRALDRRPCRVLDVQR